MASPHVIDLGEALKDMIKISRLYTRVEFVQGCPASQSSEQAHICTLLGPFVRGAKWQEERYVPLELSLLSFIMVLVKVYQG